MGLFSKNPVAVASPPTPPGPQELLNCARRENEFGQFLIEQLQEQASALLTLGSLVAPPSERMVAAIASAWLVQHLDWKAVLIFGIRDDGLILYSAFPPKPGDSAGASLLSDPQVVRSLQKKRIVICLDSQVECSEAMKALEGGCFYGVPLLKAGVPVGYMVLSGDSGREEIAEELGKSVAQSVVLASTLAELAKQTQKLQELDTIRNSFISTTSHQLRTPLSVVKWMFSVFLSDPELMKMETQMHMLLQAYSGVERIIDVVNDLLNVSRIQNGSLPYTPQMANPTGVLTAISDDVKPILESRNVTLKLDIQKDLPQFEFDAILLREALQNLVNNAVDYNVEKGTVSIAAHTVGDWLEISVGNTGVGIKAEEKGRMFTPLYRSPDAVLLHPDGSGLGLYLVKAIANAHGGSVTFESVPGELTTFVLRVPLSPPQKTLPA